MQENNLIHADLLLPMPVARIGWMKYPNASEPVRQLVEETLATEKPIGSEVALRTGTSHLHGCSGQPRKVPARRN